MSGEIQLEKVQQKIADIGRVVSNLEAPLAATGQAGDDGKVEYLRQTEVALRRDKVARVKQETILLRAQRAGVYCSLLPPLA